MSISPTEQLMIELINRARLDPLAEGDRLGIDIRVNVDAWLDENPSQALAPNALLAASAEAHSNWMLDTNTFSKTGMNGSFPRQRMEAAGYRFDRYISSGETISWLGSTDPLDLEQAIRDQHDELMHSPVDRGNLLTRVHREIGVAQVVGSYTDSDGTIYANTSMLTQDIATPGTAVFLTGVAYNDIDANGFYSIGEGVAGVGFEASGVSTSSLSAGGYALRFETPGLVDVTVQSGAEQLRLTVKLWTGHIFEGNGKLDVVNGTEILTSVSTTITSGVTSARLLGSGDLWLTGSEEADTLIGNRGASLIQGGDGDDLIIGVGRGNDLRGDGGNDTIHGGDNARTIGGGDGDDLIYVGGIASQLRHYSSTIWGGYGSDTVHGSDWNEQIHGGGDGTNHLFGNGGNDNIWGGNGGDLIGGGAGHDLVRAGSGADTIYGGLGDDNIGGGAGDDLIFGVTGKNTLWAGYGNDTVQGGDGNDSIFGGDGDNQLFGNDGDDVIKAGLGSGLLSGGAGNDTLLGRAGDDMIYLGLGDDCAGGGAGNDVIVAGAGENRISGDYGDDTIHAGTGRDIMDGGPGADVFIFASAGHVGLAAGRDRINDFTSGIDRIDLSAMELTYIGTADFSGTAGELRKLSRFLVGDIDGDGLNDFAIELSGAPMLTVDDLIL